VPAAWASSAERGAVRAGEPDWTDLDGESLLVMFVPFS